MRAPSLAWCGPAGWVRGTRWPPSRPSGLPGRPPGVAVSSGTAALHLASSGWHRSRARVILPATSRGALHASSTWGPRPGWPRGPPDFQSRPGVCAGITADARPVIVPHLFGSRRTSMPCSASGLPLIEDRPPGRHLSGRPVDVRCRRHPVLLCQKLLTTARRHVLAGTSLSHAADGRTTTSAPARPALQL